MKVKNKIVQLTPEVGQWTADCILQKINFSEIEGKFQNLTRGEE